MSVCVNCRAPLVVIEMTVAGRPTRMMSCSSCGLRRWTFGDDTIDVSDVLAAASSDVVPRRPRVDPPHVA